LPRGKALRATNDNKTRYEGMKTELEKRNLELKGDAGKLAAKLDGKSVVVIRQASETGQLFGSVSTRDIASLLSTDDIEVSRSQVALNTPIKSIGQYKVPLALHPEIDVTVTVLVARSDDEAQRLVRGEDVTVRREPGADEEEAEAVLADAEAAFFEPEVAEPRADGEEPEDADTDAKAEKPAKRSKKAETADE
jgi:large subunit ribosomal protein L9